MQNCLHELTVVLQHRRLAGMEMQRLRPSFADTNLQNPLLCFFVRGSWIFDHVETRNSNSAGNERDVHKLIEYCGRCRLALGSCCARFKTYSVDGGIHLRYPNDLLNLL